MRIFIIIIIAIVLLSLVVFTIIYNNKDRKKFERQLSNDDSTVNQAEPDIETDDTIKSSQ